MIRRKCFGLVLSHTKMCVHVVIFTSEKIYFPLHSYNHLGMCKKRLRKCHKRGFRLRRRQTSEGWGERWWLWGGIEQSLRVNKLFGKICLGAVFPSRNIVRIFHTVFHLSFVLCEGWKEIFFGINEKFYASIIFLCLKMDQMA